MTVRSQRSHGEGWLGGLWVQRQTRDDFVALLSDILTTLQGFTKFSTTILPAYIVSYFLVAITADLPPSYHLMYSFQLFPLWFDILTSLQAFTKFSTTSPPAYVVFCFSVAITVDLPPDRKSVV